MSGTATLVALLPRGVGPLAVALIALVGLLVLGVLVAACLLCGACDLYNRLVGGRGSPRSVPEPSIRKAAVVIIVTALVRFVVVGCVVLVFASKGRQTDGISRETAILVEVISEAIGFLVMADLLRGALPTTFGRAILVILCYLLIVFLLAVVLGAIFGGLFLWFLRPPS